MVDGKMHIAHNIENAPSELLGFKIDQCHVYRSCVVRD